jgi:hypothetical protein
MVLVCNWPHSVGQNHFFVKMFLNRDFAIQSTSRRLCTVYKSENLIPCQPFGRRDIPSRRPTVQTSFVRTTGTFRLDLPLRREASNCSSLHLCGRFSSTSERHSVFDQLWDFFPKHKYGKFAATVRTMWNPVRTDSSIRQVSHSKSRLPDARALDMEIACIRSTVRTTIPLVRTNEAFILKLLAAEVRPSGWQGTTVWTRLKSGKNFCEFWKADRTVVRLDVLSLPSGRHLGCIKPGAHLNL